MRIPSDFNDSCVFIFWLSALDSPNPRMQAMDSIHKRTLGLLFSGAQSNNNEKVETAWSDTVVFVTDSPKIMWDEEWAEDEKQLK